MVFICRRIISCWVYDAIFKLKILHETLIHMIFVLLLRSNFYRAMNNAIYGDLSVLSCVRCYDYLNSFSQFRLRWKKEALLQTLPLSLNSNTLNVTTEFVAVKNARFVFFSHLMICVLYFFNNQLHVHSFFHKKIQSCVLIKSSKKEMCGAYDL